MRSRRCCGLLFHMQGYKVMVLIPSAAVMNKKFKFAPSLQIQILVQITSLYVITVCGF